MASFDEKTALRIASDTTDAYSYDSFNSGEWYRSVANLLAIGFSDAEVKEIMYSKITRWCRDEFSEDNRGSAEQVVAFISKYNIRPGNVINWLKR